MLPIFLLILGMLGFGVSFGLRTLMPGQTTAFTSVLGLSIASIVFALVALVTKLVKAKVAAKALDKTLDEQGDEQERNARPDQQPEIQEMRAEFNKAISTLKTSKLARKGADPLAVLPWYVIVGPPGAGKSTALRNSGLKFPYLSKRGGGVRGVGGTRNCDWWLTNEAVILDTAGRYTTEDDDRDEWLAFLDSLVKARAKRPINGLIVAVSVGDLLGTDEAGAAELGQQLRERVDEVTGHLKLVVPVYLLLTKCDLLSGFVESFNDLPRSERSQVWGFTYGQDDRHVDGPRVQVLERFDEIIEVQEERMLQRIAKERKLDVRERIFQFPRQVEALRANLGELVEPLFTENPYQDTPLLRGVYFTSGTQEGRPIDKVMSAMAAAFDIRGQLPASAEPVKDAKSYFLGQLFTDIIFKDQALAVHSSAAVARQKRLRYAYTGGAIALAMLLVLLPALAFSGSRSAARSLQEKFKAVSEMTARDDRLAKLADLRDEVIELRKQDDSSVSHASSFGLDVTHELLEAAIPVYGLWVRQLLVSPVVNADVADMKAVLEGKLSVGSAPSSASYRPRKGEKPAAPPRTIEEDVLFEKFKRYRLLSLVDAELAEHPFNPLQLNTLIPRLSMDWLAQNRGTPQKPESIQAHLQLLLDLWPVRHQAWRYDRDPSVIRGIQPIVVRMDRSKRLLADRLKFWSKGSEIRLVDITKDQSVYQSDQAVSQSFTRAIWEDVVQADLDKPQPDWDSWLIGAGTNEGSVENPIKEAYYKRYILDWEGFLRSITFVRPDSSDAVFQRLDVLASDSQSPLKKIFDKIKGDLVLATMVDRGVDSIARKVGINRGPPEEARQIDAAFAALTQYDVEEYRKKLGEFREAVKKGADDPKAKVAVARQLRQEAKGLDITVRAEARSKGSLYEAVITRLMVRPLEEMADVLDAGDRSARNLGWCEMVYRAFDRNIDRHFPFNMAGTDVEMSDFKDMYRPKDGRVEKFYNDELKDRAASDGEAYSFTDPGEQTYLPAVLPFLTKSKEIRDGFFPNDVPEPVVEISLQFDHPPAKYKLMTVKVEDTQVVADTGGIRGSNTLRWTGGMKGRGASIVLVKNDGGQDIVPCSGCSGEWGLFRLLTSGKVVRSGPRMLTEVWKSREGAEVVMTLSWSRAGSPLNGFGEDRSGSLRFAMFRNVDPPGAIIRGVGKCK